MTFLGGLDVVDFSFSVDVAGSLSLAVDGGSFFSAGVFLGGILDLGWWKVVERI